MNVLILSILLNSTPFELHIKTFNSFLCNMVVDGIKEKDISVENSTLKINNIYCKEIK